GRGRIDHHFAGMCASAEPALGSSFALLKNKHARGQFGLQEHPIVRAVLLREGLYGGECALGRQFLPDAGCDFVTEQRHRDDESEASAVSQQIETATDEKLVEILFCD